MKLFLFWMIPCLCVTTTLGAPSADITYLNANIYTKNEKQPKAEAIAVKGERIVFVGTAKDAQSYQGENTRIIDLHGLTVVPGLTDSHCHIFGVGEREMNLNLEGTRTREEFLASVKERVAGKMGHRPWLDRDFLDTAGFPDRRRSG